MERFDHLELCYLSIYDFDLWFLKGPDKVLIVKNKGPQKEKGNWKNENKINGVKKFFDRGFDMADKDNQRFHFIQLK